MKITSWNVNGIRAAINKDIFSWIAEQNAEVVCLQEIKAKEDQVDTNLIASAGYDHTINPAERPGYSGVATLHRKEPSNIEKGLGVKRFDIEGRVIRYTYPEFELFNVYFPNGGRGLERIQYKLDFYDKLLNICDKLMADGKEIIITGDFNTAHQEIDLKNPKANEKNTGFLPEERVWIDHYLDHGFYDAFRVLYPEEEQYTWWTYRFYARKNNVGWRIDYFLVTEGVMGKTKEVINHTEVMGSDHCPVTLVLI